MATVTFGSVRLTVWEAPDGDTRSYEPVRGEATAWLHVVCRGAIAVGHGVEGKTAVASGGALVRDAGPHAVRAATHTKVVTLRFPEAILHGVALPTDTTLIAAGDSALLAPLAEFAARAAGSDVDETSTLAAYYFERVLQEMTIGLLVDAARARAVPRSPEQFTLALSIITAQLADTELSPTMIARSLNTSLRQLQRQFRRHDTTVEREIRRSRVEYASRLLRDRSYDALSIDQVARFAGFAGGSSLARAMATEGGSSPAKVRRLSRGEEPAAEPAGI